jgi:hypothetical protein
MPYRLDTHVLTVDANVIHKVDTGNPYNLFSMWTGEFLLGRSYDDVTLALVSWPLTQTLTYSLLSMRRLGRTGPSTRKPLLAALEQGDLLLRDAE